MTVITLLGEFPVDRSVTVVISLDAELAWGFHDLEHPPSARVANARGSWRRLLDLFDGFDIPATWAVVGHLMLDECDGSHADHPASPEHFSRDPGGTHGTQPTWFGPDLVTAIRTADADHEVGCHSFSHVLFGDDGVTTELAAAELHTCTDLAAEDGIELRSFVYPRNDVDHRDLLAEHGFVCYRDVAPERWFDRLPARPLGKAIAYAVGRTTPPLVRPTVDEYGLVRLPASLYLFGFEGRPRSMLEPVVGDPVVRQAHRAIDAVAASDGDDVFHAWLHPNNLTNERDFDRLRTILSRIAEHRDAGELSVETMGTVAERVLDARGRTGSGGMSVRAGR